MWRRGVVCAWYLKPKQRSVVDFIRVIDDPFFEGSRKFGKTTSILGWVIEENVIRQRITRWCEPWKNQCREIVIPEMDKIQSFIPKRYRFVWRQTDSFYECVWNGSRIYLRGVNEDHGESARGPSSDIIICDEFGSWKRPAYVVKEVLLPQTLISKGKMCFTGTAPKNLSQGYYEAKERAKLKGRFIQRTVKDQELVEWTQIERIVDEMGGWDCPAVRRELLCEKVIDPNAAIIPEWKDDYIQPVVTDEYFQFYFKYDGLDIGVRDKTVCVLAHYDFKKATLFFHDEVVLSGPEMTTELVANSIKAAEKQRFSFLGRVTPAPRYLSEQEKQLQQFDVRKRVSDIDLLLLQDLSKLHKLYFEPTDKGRLEEMVNEVRLWVNAGRIIVDPRCTEIIDCMRYGVWDDDRKQWERSEYLGHFDALAAVMYLVRNVDAKTNPIPADFNRPSDEYWFNEDPRKKQTKEQFKKIFGLK